MTKKYFLRSSTEAVLLDSSMINDSNIAPSFKEQWKNLINSLPIAAYVSEALANKVGVGNWIEDCEEENQIYDSGGWRKTHISMYDRFPNEKKRLYLDIPQPKQQEEEKELNARYYESRKRGEIIRKHLGDKVYYKTGEIHNAIEDAMIEYASISHPTEQQEREKQEGAQWQQSKQSDAVGVLEFLLDANVNGYKGQDDHKIIMVDGEFYWETDKDGDQPLGTEKILQLYLKSQSQKD